MVIEVWHSRKIIEEIESQLPAGYTVAGNISRGGTALIYHLNSDQLEEPPRIIKIELSKDMIEPTLGPDGRVVNSKRTLEKFVSQSMSNEAWANESLIGVDGIILPSQSGVVSYGLTKLNKLGFFVYDYCEPLANGEETTLFGLLNFFRQYAHTLSKVHSKGIAHVNVTRDNLYRGPQLIGDFGTASEVGKPLRVLASTQPYAPDELHATNYSTTGIDVFGLGVSFYQVLTGVDTNDLTPENSPNPKIFRYNQGEREVIIDALGGCSVPVRTGVDELIGGMTGSDFERVNMEKVFDECGRLIQIY